MIIYEVRKNEQIIGAFSDLDKAYELAFLSGGHIVKKKCILGKWKNYTAYLEAEKWEKHSLEE